MIDEPAFLHRIILRLSRPSLLRMPWASLSRLHALAQARQLGIATFI